MFNLFKRDTRSYLTKWEAEYSKVAANDKSAFAGNKMLIVYAVNGTPDQLKDQHNDTIDKCIIEICLFTLFQFDFWMFAKGLSNQERGGHLSKSLSAFDSVFADILSKKNLEILVDNRFPLYGNVSNKRPDPLVHSIDLLVKLISYTSRAGFKTFDDEHDIPLSIDYIKDQLIKVALGSYVSHTYPTLTTIFQILSADRRLID